MQGVGLGFRDLGEGFRVQGWWMEEIFWKPGRNKVLQSTFLRPCKLVQGFLHPLSLYNPNIYLIIIE